MKITSQYTPGGRGVSSKQNYWSKEFESQLRLVGLPEPVREYVFAPGRRFRADWAFVKHKLLIEEEGALHKVYGARRCPLCGQVQGGRHSTGTGIEKDIEKYNLATLLGFRVLRITPKMIKSGEALRLVEQALKAIQ